MRVIGRQSNRCATGGKFDYTKLSAATRRRGGRAVAFEAKSTTTNRLEHSRVTPEQSERLNRHAALGARCFILASFGNAKFYRIPWELWETKSPELFVRRKYVTAEELEPYAIRFERGILQFLTADERNADNTAFAMDTKGADNEA